MRNRQRRMGRDVIDVVIRNVLDAQDLVDCKPRESAFDVDEGAGWIASRSCFRDPPSQVEYGHGCIADIRHRMEAVSRLRQGCERNGGLDALDAVERKRQELSA